MYANSDLNNMCYNTYVDIDECEEYNDCHQICFNTVGSYNCSCRTGFMLRADNRTCERKYSN